MGVQKNGVLWRQPAVSTAVHLQDRTLGELPPYMSFFVRNEQYNNWKQIDALKKLNQTLLKSFVNTPEARPYSVPLALFKTPSMSLKKNDHDKFNKLIIHIK